ncbi:MAG: hypothetical protein JSV02_06650, partial [Dehalococcoidia bacterium]
CRQQKCSGANVLYECEFPGVRTDADTMDPQTAVAKAENNIAHMDENWGQAFNVNIPIHWFVLLIITGAMLGLTMAVLKLKDRR